MAGMLGAVCLVGSAEASGSALAAPASAAPPKQYRETCEKVVSTVIASVQLDRDGAKETEVRRKADEARDQVKSFVSRWRDNPSTSGLVATVEIGAALRELGTFYLNNGQRSRLPADLSASVLSHLELAETYLNGLN